MDHSEMAKKFADGATKGKASNMFIEGDTLYSYGHHFPLMERMDWGYLQNADRYSVTTSKHQGHCRRYATVLIPFSSLYSAGIDIRGMKLIDKTEARTDEREYTDKEGKLKTVYERRPESCVISTGLKSFLSSMDGQNYFLTLLPRKAKTVPDGFISLLPKEIKPEMVEGTDYLRQGEWFFIPIPPLSGKIETVGKGMGKRPQILPYWQQCENDKEPGKHPETMKVVAVNFLLNRKNNVHHYATEYGKVKGCKHQIIRGTVRHSQGDHRMLKLGDGKTWFMAIESRHVQSWGVSGKVD